jgi:hypothetical protein
MKNSLYNKKEDNWQTSNISLIKNLNIEYGEDGRASLREKFPDEFTVSFEEFNATFRVTFVKKPNLEGYSDDVYVMDSQSGTPVKHKWTLDVQDEYAHYAQKNGHGFATLIRNHKTDENNPFRLVCSLAYGLFLTEKRNTKSK